MKPGAIIFMIFPKRDALEQDKPRPISTLDEILATYRLYGTRSANHFVSSDRPDCHFFVWTLELMTCLISHCNECIGLGWDILYTEETDTKIGNGHTVIVRRQKAAAINVA